MMKSENSDVWVVVPAFREAQAIGMVLQDLQQHGYTNIVVIDDCSPDATARIALQAGVHVLRHAVNRGQGAALQTGMAYAMQAGAACIITFDADGQHHASDIAALLAPLRMGRAAVALGSRFLTPHATVQVPLLKRFALQCGVLFTRILSGIALTDTHNGLRALTAAAAARIAITQDRMTHASEILDQISRKRIPYVEVPVTITYHAYAQQKGQGAGAAFSIAAGVLIKKLLR